MLTPSHVLVFTMTIYNYDTIAMQSCGVLMQIVYWNVGLRRGMAAGESQF